METQESTQETEATSTPKSEKVTAKKGGAKAKGKGKTEKKVKAWAWKKDPKKIAQLKKDIPLGSLVKYTGSRVEAMEGKQGVVIGYRDANGLDVDCGQLGK